MNYLNNKEYLELFLGCILVVSGLFLMIYHILIFLNKYRNSSENDKSKRSLSNLFFIRNLIPFLPYIVSKQKFLSNKNMIRYNVNLSVMLIVYIIFILLNN